MEGIEGFRKILVSVNFLGGRISSHLKNTALFFNAYQ